jgi:hypothetical protein
VQFSVRWPKTRRPSFRAGKNDITIALAANGLALVSTPALCRLGFGVADLDTDRPVRC